LIARCDWPLAELDGALRLAAPRVRVAVLPAAGLGDRAAGLGAAIGRAAGARCS